jgi:hypothetical protein
MSSARSFAALGHYVSMDRNSRNAMDRMTREIRRAGDLVEFSSTHLKFVVMGRPIPFWCMIGTPTPASSPNGRPGRLTTNVLLSECDNLAFYMRRDHSYPPRSFPKAKRSRSDWKCSRTILGKKTHFRRYGASTDHHPQQTNMKVRHSSSSLKQAVSWLSP